LFHKSDNLIDIDECLLIFIQLYGILLYIEKERLIRLRIGICDDNKIYLEFIHEKVSCQFKNSKNIYIEELNPIELALQLENKICPFDIIITDIDMGSLNGIALAKEINKINSSCCIIFISNYLNYALDVYETQHIYFVLKSEAEERIPKALEKAVSVYNGRKYHCLTIKYQNVEHRIPHMDITHIEALGRYLYIYDCIQSYKCINSLKGISTELTETFARCHNSYIVNLDYVRSISRINCVLKSGINIPISQTFLKPFQASYINFVSKKLE